MTSANPGETSHGLLTSSIPPPPGLSLTHANTFQRVQFNVPLGTPAPPGLIHPEALRPVNNSLPGASIPSQLYGPGIGPSHGVQQPQPLPMYGNPTNIRPVPSYVSTAQAMPQHYPPFFVPYHPYQHPSVAAYSDAHYVPVQNSTTVPVPLSSGLVQPPQMMYNNALHLQQYATSASSSQIVYQSSLPPVKQPGSYLVQQQRPFHGATNLPFGQVPYPAEQQQQASPAPAITHDTSIHRDWVGKLAPLPGFTSPDGLGPPPQRVKIRPSSNNIRNRHALKLPEPGTNAASPIVPLSKTHSSAAQEVNSPTTSSAIPETLSAPRSPSLSPFALSGSLSDTNTSVQNIETPLHETADTFIPQYLKNVQSTIHRMIPLPPTPQFPDPSYLSTFLPQKLISELFSSSEQLKGRNIPYAHKPSLISSPAPIMDKVPQLRQDSYHARWRVLLGFELSQVAEDKSHTVLWETGLNAWNFQEAEFTVAVPGIRENYPKLDPGDIIHLREAFKSHRAISGNAFEGRITVLRKREGIVHFKAPELKKHIDLYVRIPGKDPGPNGQVIWDKNEELPMFFNYSFLTNPRPFCDMDLAAQVLSEDLASEGSQLSRRWLFPQHADLGASFLPNEDTEEIEDENWVDRGLNDEQKLAVSSIALRHWPVPYLISGPPGTGKTRTLVEAVLQITRTQPDACILLCAPSNPATDILVLRLRDHLDPKQMLRLNDVTRTFAEVPISITQYCYVEDDKFGVPPWEQLMKYRVVVCSCTDAMILYKAGCTNKVLAQLEESIMDGLYPHKKTKQPIRPHWTHLLIDEAAQGMETELAIPISILLTPAPRSVEGLVDIEFKEGILSPQLILCGDQNQLGPIVSSPHAVEGGLNVSLLERLFQRQLYADNEFARSNLTTRTYVQSERSGAVPFTNLVKNYRSHPAILMTPSALFYNDTLDPCANNGYIHWPGLSNPNLPFRFIGHDTEEDCNDERVNFFNVGDISHIVETCQSLLSDATSAEPPLKASQIGVIAPWREQVWKIRERLRKEGLNDVDVGTVEDYQGRENRVIILSCVRSRSRFLREDEEKGVGLVFEKKRMNVSITRAKELFVIVGNGRFLMRDPYWRSYLQFAQRNKLYTGPDLEIMPDPNYISRLESVYVQSPNVALELDEDEIGLRLAGDLAREVLKE